MRPEAVKYHVPTLAEVITGILRTAVEGELYTTEDDAGDGAFEGGGRAGGGHVQLGEGK